MSQAILDALLDQQPNNSDLIHKHGMLLTILGQVMVAQGRYLEAREAYEEALRIDEELGRVRSRASDLQSLGTLARMLGNFTEAQMHYTKALDLFSTLGEPAKIADILNGLGIVAMGQEAWAEAAQYFRESLALMEQLADRAGAARVCNHLAAIALSAGRTAEAEGWWKRALELHEQVEPGSLEVAKYYNNLATCLLTDVQAGLIPASRLTEARGYAEQSLAIREPLDVSSEIWNPLCILVEIAELEGRTEAALAYLRRARETYASFADHRNFIDTECGSLIAAIAAAAMSSTRARAWVIAELPQLRMEAELPRHEVHGWRLVVSTQRIWLGERDWHTLVEGLSLMEALLVMRVLETITLITGDYSGELETLPNGQEQSRVKTW